MSVSQGFQECDEGLPVLQGKLQPERMSLDRAGFHAAIMEACRDIVVPQTTRIEPVLQGRHRARVLEGPAIPNALEGRNLVEARPAPGIERQSRIGTDGERNDV